MMPRHYRFRTFLLLSILLRVLICSQMYVVWIVRRHAVIWSFAKLWCHASDMLCSADSPKILMRSLLIDLVVWNVVPMYEKPLENSRVRAIIVQITGRIDKTEPHNSYRHRGNTRFKNCQLMIMGSHQERESRDKWEAESVSKQCWIWHELHIHCLSKFERAFEWRPCKSWLLDTR